MKKSKKKSKAVTALLWAVILIFGTVTVVAGIKVSQIQEVYSESGNTYNEIADTYVTHTEESAPISAPVISSPFEEELPEPERSPITIDFDQLAAEVAVGQISGWLYCEDTPINYPVAYSGDNSYYLSHLITGKANGCGALFIDCTCSPDFSDYHTIIYGHHMGDGSMFGSLDNWRKDEYAVEHSIMYLNTPEGDYRLDYVGWYVTGTQTEAFSTGMQTEITYQRFLDYLYSSFSNTPSIKLTTEDRVVSFCTCSYESNNVRQITVFRLTPLA